MAAGSLLAEGCAAYAAGQLAAAEAAFRALADRAPDDAEALSNLGAVLNAAQRHGEAEAACRASLARQPGFWAAWGNLGTALHSQQRYGEAMEAYATALRLNPHDANAWTNLGVALAEQGMARQALAVHAAAVELAPQDAGGAGQSCARLAGRRRPGARVRRARMALAVCRACCRTGWKGRAGRARTRPGGPFWCMTRAASATRCSSCATCRCWPQRGARVVLRVQPPLVRLLRRLPGPVAVLGRGEAVPAYDLHCPMLTLPHCFATTLQSVPAQVPYLKADAAKAALWRARLDGEGLRVGLVWAGASRPGMAVAHAMDARRSLPAEALAPLARHCAGCGSCRCRRTGRRRRGSGVADPMPDCADFDDTAAVVAGLDLVIAVDTSVAHLAGALGRPVWLLSRYDMCWRWLHGRRDSPWYPGLRLYRQPAPGEWGPVLREVAEDLRALAAGGGQGRRSEFRRQVGHGGEQHEPQHPAGQGKKREEKRPETRSDCASPRWCPAAGCRRNS